MAKFKNAQEIINLVKERQELEKVEICPRCGEETMKERLHTNALSRKENVYICDDCGTSEAVNEYMCIDFGIEHWYIVKSCKEEGLLD